MADFPIKVKVLDENQEPLTGVKLIEVNKNDIRYTDFDGVSTIQMNDRPTVIRVEFAGYESGIIKLSPNTSAEELEITLIKK